MSSWYKLLSPWLPIAAVLATAGPAAAGDPLPPLMPGCDLTLESDRERVFVSTPLGDITLQLFPSVAPNTVDNFLGYIDRGDYEDTIFHRVEPNDPGDPADDFVIQAGGFAQSGISFGRIDTQEEIENEPCISNVQGTVAMAKLGDAPDSATSQWFVNLTDNTGLDDTNGGFTVFGRVLFDGLDVATAIVNLTDRVPANPLPPYLADTLQPSWPIFRDSPLLSPLPPIPLIHGCFDPDQSGAVLVENPATPTDFEPGTVQDLPYAIVSTACVGAGTGDSPEFACNPPGRRIILVDPDTGSLMLDASAPFGFAESFLACDEIAASDAGFTARLTEIGSQLDVALVKTSYTVPEPGIALTTMASLVTLAALARASRRRHG